MSGVGPLTVGYRWLVGEGNRSSWAAVGVFGKKSWEKLQVDSVVMSNKFRFI